MPVSKALFSSDKDEWETPPWLFNYYNSWYNYDIDVCATKENAKCPEFFTPEQDGLAQSWAGKRVWMNPPYGRKIKHWIGKAISERRSASLITMLIPARTDTEWWHDLVVPYTNMRIDLLKGRIHFIINGKRAKDGAPFPSAVITILPRATRTDGDIHLMKDVNWLDIRHEELRYARSLEMGLSQ